MIPVAPQPEPAGFDANVRRQGAKVLAKTPPPTVDELVPHWKWAGRDLYAAYGRICAYCCMYIATPNGSIDHYKPKSIYMDLAYEWDNFRLAHPRVNSHKGNKVGVVDPFTLEPHWFVLDFPSCLVKANDNLGDEAKTQVRQSIDILKLNDDDHFVQERCDIMVLFAQGHVTLAFLERRYPFLASEVVRQGIAGTAGDLFKAAN